MEHTILILILPFLSFLILGLAGMRMKNGLAGTIGTVSLAGVTLLSYLTAFNYFAGGRTAEGVYPTLTPYNFEWLPFTTNLHIDMGIMLDPISVMMLVVISTVSLMVHIYSFGYMKGEKGFQRYYAFLSLFTMSMLGLVVATNIFQMYVFWELVGVSSYLLIGFYYTKKEAIAASKKAFIGANIETEIAPIVGSEEQANDLIAYIREGEKSEEGAWETNIFGKSIGELMENGIRGKISMMDDECQMKLQDTMQKIVNDNNGGMVCIIL